MMPRVDFYILSTAEAAQRNLFAARLAEKAWRQNNSVALLTESTGVSVHLDELLWNFRPDAFVPHAIAPEAAPVVIGDVAEVMPACDLIINLSRNLPACSPRQRLAEIVIQDAEILVQTRDRFGRYRQAGFELFTHKIP